MAEVLGRCICTEEDYFEGDDGQVAASAPGIMDGSLYAMKVYGEWIFVKNS
jgi:hypothetical protein